MLLKAAPLRLWALISLSPIISGMAAWLIYMIRNGWPPEAAHQQLNILGNTLYIYAALNGIIIITFAAVRVSGHGPAGLAFDVDGGSGDNQKRAVVTTTVEAHTETKPTEIQ